MSAAAGGVTRAAVTAASVTGLVALVAVTGVVLAACGGGATTHRTAAPVVAKAPSPDVPIELMPSGMELVAEIDVTQLRAWPTWARMSRLRSEIADAATAKLDLEQLGVDPLADLDEVAVGATGVGGEAVELTLVARGRLSAKRLREALAGSGGQVEQSEYHGGRLYLRGGDGFALLGPQTAVSGRGVDVRRAVDVLAGDEPGLLRAPSSRPLVEALERAPGAKQGRPALRLALLVTPAVRERAAALDLAPTIAPLRWIALAVAIGDGADLGIVAGTKDERAAAAWIEAARRDLATLKTKPALRVLGLAPYVDDVRFGRKGAEAHLAFRLPDRRLADLLDRVEALMRVAARQRKTSDNPE